MTASVDPDQMPHSFASDLGLVVLYTVCYARLSQYLGQMFVCLCWGFTAQSTQWGHVERSQFT